MRASFMKFLSVLFISACAYNSAQVTVNESVETQEDFRVEAIWATYLENNPSNSELRDVILNGSTSFFREAAASELVNRRPADSNLLVVIGSSIRPSTDFYPTAVEIFANKDRATNVQLIFGICYAPKDLRQELEGALYKKNPSNEDLSWLLRCGSEELLVQTAERILENNPSDNDLVRVRDYAPHTYSEIAS